MKPAKVKVILPFKEVDDYVRMCINKCKNLNYENYDVVLLPDHNINDNFGCAVIPVPGFPATKRNAGVKNSGADFIAFIDSDAYPRKDWLSNAVPIFKDPTVAAVGGPNLVRPDANELEKLSADVIYSKMCTGSSYPIRKYKGGAWEYKEIASSNLIVRRSVFEELGGFDTRYLTSEDSKLCWQIRTKLGKKVVWHKDVVVYHRRRPLFWPHMKRMFVEGRNKACIFWEVRKYWSFALPTLFLLGLVVGPVFFLVHFLFIPVYVGVLALYFSWAIIEADKVKRWRSLLFPPAVFVTHIFYGAGFLYGSIAGEEQP